MFDHAYHKYSEHISRIVFLDILNAKFFGWEKIFRIIVAKLIGDNSGRHLSHRLG